MFKDNFDVVHKVVSGLSLGNTLAMAILFNLSFGYSSITQAICLLILLASAVTTGVSFLPNGKPK
jgi:hypothetical protein